MKANKTLAIGIIAWLMTAYVLFGAILLSRIGKVEQNVTYVPADPVYEVVDEIVEKDVYHQNTPVFPIKTTGKEVILLDKSGSMKDFVNSIYTSNIAFFTKHDVWAFDTNIYQDAKVKDIEFGGDTNIFQAINMAAEQGYNTIWLCSDLEHNTGELTLSEAAKEMTIVVYSPKVLEGEKSQQTLEKLGECNKVLVITIS